MLFLLRRRQIVRRFFEVPAEAVRGQLLAVPAVMSAAVMTTVVTGAAGGGGAAAVADNGSIADNSGRRQAVDIANAVRMVGPAVGHAIMEMAAGNVAAIHGAGRAGGRQAAEVAHAVHMQGSAVDGAVMEMAASDGAAVYSAGRAGAGQAADAAHAAFVVDSAVGCAVVEMVAGNGAAVHGAGRVCGGNRLAGLLPVSAMAAMGRRRDGQQECSQDAGHKGFRVHWKDLLKIC